MSIDSDRRIDYLYKEYARLSEKSDELIKSTFDDFRLYGVVGATIVLWKPIADFISPNSKFDPIYIFLGFLSLLAVVGLISYLNLVKQAYTWYFVHNLQAYEIEIKRVLGEAEDSQIFNFNLGKEEPKFITSVYKTSFKLFVIFFAFIVIFIPFTILCYSKVLYAVIYLLLGMLGSIAFFQTFKQVIRQYSNSSYL